jgi:hypothetical protein
VHGYPTINIAYPVLIPSALRELGQDIESDAEAALVEIAEGLVTIYQEEIEAVGAVDTRFFLETVDIRYATRFERGVGSRAFYAGVVEHGWTARARGQESYPGRFPAARAISRLEPVIESAFDRQLRR